MDEWLRNLLFKRCKMGRYSFDFLEALLAVCITGVGYLLRTPFDTGLPYWPYLLVEWYLSLASAILIWRCTKSRKKTIGTYAILLILPTIIADGTILRGNACIGALLFVSALLFLTQQKQWLFVLTLAALLLWSVKYAGILFACMTLWQSRRLKAEQLLVLAAAGGARFVYTYRIWLNAGYTLVTFHWPNIYEIVGKKAVTGQLVDPISMIGLFLTLGLMVLTVYLFSLGDLKPDNAVLLRLFLFFGLAVGYFLPYMDQSYGYLYCVLSVLYFMLIPREFPVPMLLQIIAYMGYQECFNEISMMPMPVFAILQFLVITWLGIQLLQEAGVLTLCRQRN